MTKQITRQHVQTTMRDGIQLGADLFLPPGAGPFPTIVERTAHYKERDFSNPLFEFLAENGFAVLAQNSADRWQAERKPRPFFSADTTEAADGYDTIVWTGQQSWCNQRIGGYGFSYPSWCQWMLAAQQPPHLVTLFTGGMAPRSTDFQMGGIFRIGRNMPWTLGPMGSTTQGWFERPFGPDTYAKYWHNLRHVERDKWLWFLPQKELPLEFIGGVRERFVDWLDHIHEDRWKLHEDFHKIDLPVYHRTSWYDRLSRTVEMFSGMVRHAPSAEARAAQRMIVGPWSHRGSHLFPRRVGDVDFGPDAEMSLFDLVLPWFDYWLKGADNGVMERPPVRLFVMGANTWRDEQEWPLARAQETDFFLGSGGSANTAFGDGSLDRCGPRGAASDRYRYDPRDPVMTLYAFDGQDEPLDQRALDHRQDVLVFRTEALAEPIEVTGVPRLVLFAASSARDTDFTVKLIDEYPDGFAQNLCYGIVRARYRNGFHEAKLLQPDQVYEYEIELMPTSNRFRAGHRIRVDVSSSDFPNFDRNHNTGGDDYGAANLVAAEQTVFHEPARPSRMVLPVIR